jgi:uncharacterized protein (TIGR02145 family)
MIPTLIGTYWSNHENNLPANGSAYGKLYNSYTVHDSRGIAPVGWHIPDNEEWTVLCDYLATNGFGFKGSGGDIGKSLASQSGWTENSVEGTVGNNPLSNNSSGFNGLAAGYRYYDGTFTYMGVYTFWWNNSVVNNDFTWYRSFSKFWAVLYKDFTINSSGMSLRCVKD